LIQPAEPQHVSTLVPLRDGGEGAAAAAVAKAAVTTFAAGIEPGPERRTGLAEVVLGPGEVTGEGDAGPAARQRALAWHLLRLVLAGLYNLNSVFPIA
jgi:hypothetical protein